jgi:Tol biopolymer transport system component/DNA-binding winged helix-turn-helix (wHTH) protein
LECNSLYRFAQFRLDLENEELWLEDRRVHLTPKVFQTLRVLFLNRHRIVTRRELVDQVWEGQFVEDANITQTVSVLRKALVSAPNSPPVIATFPGQGYRFVAAAESVPGPPTPLRPHQQAALVPSPLAKSGEHSAVSLPSNQPPKTRLSWHYLVAAAVVLVSIVSSLLILPRESHSRVTITEWKPLEGVSGTIFEPTLSPDGEYLAYVEQLGSSEASLIVCKSDSVAGQEPVFHGHGQISSLAWAPDGQRIAFLFGSDTTREIIIVDLLAQTQRSAGTVFPHRYGLPFRMLAWSADGRMIAVSDKDRHEQPFNIQLLHLENGSRTVLSYPHRSTVGDLEPAFSPDGTMLAFQRMISWVGSDAYIVTLPSTEARRVTERTESIYGLGWAPDGENLIYCMLQHGEYKLFAHSLALGTVQELGRVSKLLFQFSLPRNGPRIVYANYPLKPGLSVFDLAAPDAGFRHLAYSDSEDGAAQYSPDGKRIAFLSSRSGSSQIWVSDEHGEELRQLSFEAEPPQYPNWSPDSKSIATMIGSSSGREIVLFDIESGLRKSIELVGGSGSHAGFSPDGRSFYFKRGISLHRVPLAGGEPVHVSDQVGFPIRFDTISSSLLYSQSRTSADLWSVDVRFHHARRMFERLLYPGCFSCWTALADDIFYIGKGPEGDPRPWLSRVSRSAPHRTQGIAALDNLPPIGTSFLAAHPEGNRVIIGSMIPMESVVHTARFSPGWAGVYSRSE